MFQIQDGDFAEATACLQRLLRIDTSNPPGCEAEATRCVASALEEDGLTFEWVEPRPGRANLVSRQSGNGTLPPLLLSCHLDVVPASSQGWTHPPFGGVEADGCLWGRGAIDMKGFATMALHVFRQIRRERWPLKRDVIFAAVADEETGCQWGSRYLVENRPDLVRAEYVVNEVGGFSIAHHGKRIYLVQRAERGIAWLRLRFPGVSGHSSQPCPESAMTRAATAVRLLSQAHLPHHPCASSRDFLEGMALHSNALEAAVLRGMKLPAQGRMLLRSLVPPGSRRRSLQAALSNTVVPTTIRSGQKINVVPSEVVLEIDGRTVPGSSTAELIAEIRALLGPGVEIEPILDEPGVEFPIDTPFFQAIRDTLATRDPGSAVVPYMIPGFTDSRHWARLGATCYGFYPLKLPLDLDFASLFHGIDERIPLESFRFGLETLRDLIWKLAVSA